MKLDWEIIDGYHFRLKVPGGWIFKVIEDVIHFDENRGWQTGQDFRPTICFVPDPTHTWQLEK